MPDERERSAPVALPDSSAAPGSGGRRPPWRKLWNWGLPALLLPPALLLNPDEAHHREALRQAIDAQHPVAAGFGAQALADLPVSYHSVGLLSWTRHDRDLTTVGAFGQVVAVGKRGRMAASPGR